MSISNDVLKSTKNDINIAFNSNDCSVENITCEIFDDILKFHIKVSNIINLNQANTIKLSLENQGYKINFMSWGIDGIKLDIALIEIFDDEDEIEQESIEEHILTGLGVGFLCGLCILPVLNFLIFSFNELGITNLLQRVNLKTQLVDYSSYDVFKYAIVFGLLLFITAVVEIFWVEDDINWSWTYINSLNKINRKELSEEDENEEEVEETEEGKIGDNKSNFSVVNYTLIALALINSIIEILAADQASYDRGVPGSIQPNILAIGITYFLTRYLMKKILNTYPNLNFKIPGTIIVWCIIVFIKALILG